MIWVQRPEQQLLSFFISNWWTWFFLWQGYSILTRILLQICKSVLVQFWKVQYWQFWNHHNLNTWPYSWLAYLKGCLVQSIELLLSRVRNGTIWALVSEYKMVGKHRDEEWIKAFLFEEESIYLLELCGSEDRSKPNVSTTTRHFLCISHQLNKASSYV